MRPLINLDDLQAGDEAVLHHLVRRWDFSRGRAGRSLRRFPSPLTSKTVVC